MALQRLFYAPPISRVAPSCKSLLVTSAAKPSSPSLLQWRRRSVPSPARRVLARPRGRNGDRERVRRRPLRKPIPNLTVIFAD